MCVCLEEKTIHTHKYTTANAAHDQNQDAYWLKDRIIDRKVPLATKITNQRD